MHNLVKKWERGENHACGFRAGVSPARSCLGFTEEAFVKGVESTFPNVVGARLTLLRELRVYLGRNSSNNY